MLLCYFFSTCHSSPEIVILQYILLHWHFAPRVCTLVLSFTHYWPRNVSASLALPIFTHNIIPIFTHIIPVSTLIVLTYLWHLAHYVSYQPSRFSHVMLKSWGWPGDKVMIIGTWILENVISGCGWYCRWQSTMSTQNVHFWYISGDSALSFPELGRRLEPPYTCVFIICSQANPWNPDSDDRSLSHVDWSTLSSYSDS